MTPVQLLALSTPAVIGAALLTLAYWVRTQNRSPILSNDGAQTQQTVWTAPAAGKPTTPSSPSDISDIRSELAARVVTYPRELAVESWARYVDFTRLSESIKVVARADQTKPTGDPSPIIDPSRLAEIEKLLAPSNLTFAGAERTLADAEKAIADLQRLLSRARTAAGIVPTE